MTDLNQPQRRHDIDALRVLAFALLILYHVGMFYVADWGWHIKSAYQSEWLQLPMILVNQWRLPLLFLISGVACTFLIDKVSTPRFAWLRTRRLLLPLIVGMLLIVPPQAYLQALSNQAFSGDYLSFLGAYFGFREWPAGAFDGSDIGITWNHLWFLPYLLSYSLVLAALLPLLRLRVGKQLLARLQGLRGTALFVLPVLALALGRIWLGQSYPETHAYFDDWHAHWLYGCCFLIGFVLGRNAALWQEIARLRHASLTLALCTYCLLIAGRSSWSEDANDFAVIVGDTMVSANGWIWLLAVLGWGHHCLNRPYRWLPYATEAVYPWYILHQTITVVLGYHLAQLPLGPVSEPLLVIVGTVLGCLVLHEYLIRRVNWLRPLFGLKRCPREAPTTAQDATDADLKANAHISKL